MSKLAPAEQLLVDMQTFVHPEPGKPISDLFYREHEGRLYLCATDGSRGVLVRSTRTDVHELGAANLEACVPWDAPQLGALAVRDFDGGRCFVGKGWEARLGFAPDGLGLQVSAVVGRGKNRFACRPYGHSFLRVDWGGRLDDLTPAMAFTIELRYLFSVLDFIGTPHVRVYRAPFDPAECPTPITFIAARHASVREADRIVTVMPIRV